MNSCPFDLDRVSAAIDHALSKDERESFEAHLPCARCTPQLEALAAARHALRLLPTREEPSGAVRARIEALRLRAEVPHSEVSRRRRRIAVVAAIGIAALATLAIAVTDRDRGTSRAAALLVDDHLRSVPEVRPAEIASDDPRVVAQFFDGHVSFKASAPTFPNTRLLGGRLCRIEGKLTELLFYEHEERVLSLFVTDVPLGVEGCTSARDHQVCSTKRGDLTLTLVGAVPRDKAQMLLLQAKL